jgi:sec-independent protein translocase protein TatA
VVQFPLIRCRELGSFRLGSIAHCHGCRMNFGMTELLIILVIAVVIFGANRLPELGRGLGKGIRNFKDATREATEEARKPTTEKS